MYMHMIMSLYLHKKTVCVDLILELISYIALHVYTWPEEIIDILLEIVVSVSQSQPLSAVRCQRFHDHLKHYVCVQVVHKRYYVHVQCIYIYTEGRTLSCR